MTITGIAIFTGVILIAISITWYFAYSEGYRSGYRRSHRDQGVIQHLLSELFKTERKLKNEARDRLSKIEKETVDG